MANPSKRHPGRPKKTTWENCKVNGCGQTVESGGFGMCRTHYMQAYRGVRSADGDLLRMPLRTRSYGPGAVCTVGGCKSRPVAQGLCSRHHQAVPPLLKDLDGQYAEKARSLGHCRLCVSDVVYTAAGLCPKHYKQVSRGIIDLEGNQLRELKKRSPYEGQVCLIDDCGRRPINRGMCDRHAQQRAAGILDAEGNQLRPLMPAGRRRTKDRWVGQEGYVLVRAPEGHPRARVDGTILEHRLVVEEALGRYLEEWEVVHHKNGNRSDNRPENLQVLDGRAKKSEGHPPAHESTVDDLQRRMEHLKHNNPEALASLVKRFAAS